MKWLIFVSILGAGYCEMMVGGREDLDIAKIKKETKAEYLSMSRSAIDDALSELGLEKLDKDDEIKLKKVQTQVVSGINTFITLDINGHTCEIDIYDQSWTKTHKVTRNTCTAVLSAGKRQLGGMPGGWSNATNLNDPEIQKAIGMVIDMVNARVNSMYRLTESKIVSVKQQVVAGMNYDITVICQQSSCLNNQANQHLMASRCPVNVNSAMRPVIATATVLSKPWKNFMQISNFSAKTQDIDGYKPQPVDNLLGGDGHDQAVHGKASDIKLDTQNKPPKVVLGGDDHDYQRHRYQNMMGGYGMGRGMMNGYGRGPGMMGGYGMGPGMMNGYGRGPGMMRDNYDKTADVTKDNGMGPDMMKDDWDKMADFMKENGMGPGMMGTDYDEMVDIMKKYGMGPDMMKGGWNKMLDFMKDNGMGPGMMGTNYNKMVDFMKKYGMGPDMMNDFLNENKPTGKNNIGGDSHNYQTHGQKQLGGDDHDYQPHGETKDKVEKTDCTQEMFLDFQRMYSKSYRAGKETTKRFKIFCDNMRMAGKLQQTERGTARYGVTKFSDLTEAEFKQYVGKRWQEVKNFNPGMKRADIPKGPIPQTFDWRDHGAVTAVKNQGSCGSCWAFSTTGNIEGQWAIKKQKLISLSEQELVDCDKLDEGCNGGLPSNAYKEIERLGGLETEKEYSYKGEDEKCEFIKKDVKVYINSSITISSNETEMAAWLAVNGPISIGINAFAMQFYMGGISHPWKIFCNPKDLDHGVLIVGYGVQGSKPYWIVKNSWGEDWGEKGYYLVYRGAGVCGLNTACTSSVVD